MHLILSFNKLMHHFKKNRDNYLPYIFLLKPITFCRLKFLYENPVRKYNGTKFVFLLLNFIRLTHDRLGAHSRHVLSYCKLSIRKRS